MGGVESKETSIDVVFASYDKTKSVPVSITNPAKCVVLVEHANNTNSQTYFLESYMLTNSTLTLARNTSYDSRTYKVKIIELFGNVSIQRGVSTIMDNTTVNIPIVAPTKSTNPRLIMISGNPYTSDTSSGDYYANLPKIIWNQTTSTNLAIRGAYANRASMTWNVIDILN